MTNPLYEQLFSHHADLSAPFLHLPEGEVLSYGDFLATAARLASLLHQLGLAPGDRLAAQVAKSPEALALYAGCVQAGVVFVPLNPAYTAEEMSYFITDSEARLVVCDSQGEDALVARLGADQGADAPPTETLDANGTGRLMALAALMPPVFDTVARHEDDLAALLYTSGTTGRSKGAMLTQGNLLSNARTLAESWHFSRGDVLLHALPIFHTHGLFVATNTTLVAGGSMIFLPKFDPDMMIAQMPNATVMMGVPTFYTRLLADPRFDAALTRHMRLFISGSAPLLADTHAQMTACTGHHILERYGMTETNMNTSNPYEGERRPGSVGLPLPGVALRIVNPANGQDVATGEVGQIEVRGPNVFKGYWRMPDKTAAELQADGFFITGDLGRIDDAGYVQIVGRNKDLIISGGYNIYPKEIELLLDAQPGVLESAAIGVPHADLGETVLGLIVPQAGTAAPDLDAIATALSHQLARYKHPRKLILVADLPRNAMGKVQKNLLRDTYRCLFAQA